MNNSNTVTKQKLEQIFKVYDEKRTGQIRTEQITKLIRSARLFPSQEDIVWLQNAVDPNKQGTFNISRFVDVGMDFNLAQSKINHEEELLKAFSFFDEENDLKKIMSAFGEPLYEEEVKEILKYAKAVNGKIYYRDFVKTIINGKVD